MAIGTIVAGIVPRERYGEGLGYFTLGQTLSTAIGPFVGLLLLRHGSFDSIIITCSVGAALSLVLLPLLRVKDVELTAEQVAETKGFKLSNYIEPKAVPIGLTLMLLFVCYSSVSSFLALYSEKIQLTTAAEAFYIVFAVIIFITRPAIGRRFDARGENSVVYAAILVFALSLAVLAVAYHWSVLLLAAAVMGLGFGAIQTCGRAHHGESHSAAPDGAGDLHLLHLRRHGLGPRSAVVRPPHPLDRLPGHVLGHGRRRGSVSGALLHAARQTCGRCEAEAPRRAAQASPR